MFFIIKHMVILYLVAYTNFYLFGRKEASQIIGMQGKMGGLYLTIWERVTSLQFPGGCPKGDGKKK